MGLSLTNGVTGSNMTVKKSKGGSDKNKTGKDYVKTAAVKKITPKKG
jgi:hypothetical protein